MLYIYQPVKVKSFCHRRKQGKTSLQRSLRRPHWLLRFISYSLQQYGTGLELIPLLLFKLIKLLEHLTTSNPNQKYRTHSEQCSKTVFGGEKGRHSKERTCDATTTHPACPSDLYFEEQIGTRCQLHAFNALVGSQVLCHDAVIKHLEKFSGSQPYLKECYGAAGFDDEAINHFLQHQITPAMFIGCPQSYRISLGSCKEDILKLLPPDCDRLMLRFDKASYCHATCIKYSHLAQEWFFIDSENAAPERLLDSGWRALKGTIGLPYLGSIGRETNAATVFTNGPRIEPWLNLRETTITLKGDPAINIPSQNCQMIKQQGAGKVCSTTKSLPHSCRTAARSKNRPSRRQSSRQKETLILSTNNVSQPSTDGTPVETCRKDMRELL